MGGGGWLEKLGIRLSQLSTKLKLKLSLAKDGFVSSNVIPKFKKGHIIIVDCFTLSKATEVSY